MNKKLEKTLKEANKELVGANIFHHYKIVIVGDFTTSYNEVLLQNAHGSSFPIGNAETESHAIAIIEAYMVGLRHGENNSYPKFRDRDNY